MSRTSLPVHILEPEHCGVAPVDHAVLTDPQPQGAILARPGYHVDGDDSTVMLQTQALHQHIGVQRFTD